MRLSVRTQAQSRHKNPGLYFSPFDVSDDNRKLELDCQKQRQWSVWSAPLNGLPKSEESLSHASCLSLSMCAQSCVIVSCNMPKMGGARKRVRHHRRLKRSRSLLCLDDDEEACSPSQAPDVSVVLESCRRGTQTNGETVRCVQNKVEQRNLIGCRSQLTRPG